MAEYQSDDERAEALRAWWNENGKAVVAGVLLAIGGLMGWNYWQGYTQDRAAAGSALYAQLQQQLGQQEAAQKTLDTLKEDYSGTPYAALASLHMAKQYAADKQLDKAAEVLSWAQNNASEKPVQDLAALRLARVLLAQGKVDEAEALVSKEYPTAYVALIEEIRGDVHLAKDQLDKARKAYDRAILSGGGNNEFLKMKRDNLGEEA